LVLVQDLNLLPLALRMMNFLVSRFTRVSLQKTKKPPSEPMKMKMWLCSVTLLLWTSTRTLVGGKRFFSSPKCPDLPQPPTQWLPGFLAGIKEAGAWSWPLTVHLLLRLLPHSCLHGVVWEYCIFTSYKHIDLSLWSTTVYSATLAVTVWHYTPRMFFKNSYLILNFEQTQIHTYI
jgi:hypothetical protein